MRILTVADVAAAAEVPIRTVRNHLKAGTLKGRRAGRDWVILEADAARWIQSYTPYGRRAAR